MPCRDLYYCNECGGNHDGSCPAYEKRAAEGKAKAPPPAPEALLCEACEALEDAGKLTKTSPALQAWYKKHEACEVDRLKFEIAKKLSSRERRILGLDMSILGCKVR